MKHIFGSWPTHREKRRLQRRARVRRRPLRPRPAWLEPPPQLTARTVTQ